MKKGTSRGQQNPPLEINVGKSSKTGNILVEGYDAPVTINVADGAITGEIKVVRDQYNNQHRRHRGRFGNLMSWFLDWALFIASLVQRLKDLI